MFCQRGYLNVIVFFPEPSTEDVEVDDCKFVSPVCAAAGGISCIGICCMGTIICACCTGTIIGACCIGTIICGCSACCGITIVFAAFEICAALAFPRIDISICSPGLNGEIGELGSYSGDLL